MSLNVKEIIKMLLSYPDDMVVTDEQNQNLKFIGNVGDTLIVSTANPIGVCNRSDKEVFPSVIDGYSAYSPELDEDLFDMEWTNFN